MSQYNHNQPTYRSVNSLSTAEREQLRGAINELNDSMTRAAAEKELQKNTIDTLCDKLDLDKKLVRRLAKTYFRANFSQESEEYKTFEEFYTLLNTTIPTKE